ncbi:MAG TPA: endo alpha-1,4 polygalactosaminidase [Xanthobacteraceae bacterium]|nr:endo alpha-1,4 polygalactosaminidase [Xanthobacteraceae bacterium]
MIRRLACALLMLAAATAAATAAHWRPPAGMTFSIILSVSPATVNTSAQVVDLDLFETRYSTIAALKRQGKRVVCYLSAGSWENWRPDRNRFPKSVIGKNYDGWPGEKWVDIRAESVKNIMKARMDLCKLKGFDGVDADNVNGYQQDTGFRIRRADSVAFLRFLAAEAHKRGLAFGLKNTTELARDVLPLMDFAVTEDCFGQGWCAQSRNFIAANKPVFAIEYTDNHISFPAFCQQARNLGLSPIYKKRNLDTWEKRCPP